MPRYDPNQEERNPKTVREGRTLRHPGGHSSARPEATEGLLQGTVTQVHAVRWDVKTEGGSHSCVVKRSLSRETGLPVVGDQVLFAPLDGHTGRIVHILPRKTVLYRPNVHHGQSLQVLATNLDQVIIVASIANPPINAGLLERYLIAAWRQGMQPLLCLSKCDLDMAPESAAALEGLSGLDLPALMTSSEAGLGLPELLEAMTGKISVMVGLSGTGKTSLARSILQDDSLRISEVSEATGRGRHTTSSARWLELPGGRPGALIDMPGQRVFSLNDIEEKDLRMGFPELSGLDPCQLPACTHQNEPGCTLLEAVERGQLTPQRYAGYMRILADILV